jgi:hypothetical protein
MVKFTINIDETKTNSSSVRDRKNIVIPSLNFENIARSDFNSEFLENADRFSPSWRDECKKIKF